GLVPRDDGPCASDDITWFSIDPCYIFHPMNAYDEVDAEGNVRVVLDAVRHPKMFDRERRGPNEGAPRLDRWEFDLRAGTATQHTLDDYPQEFPRVREDLVGRPYRFGYSAGLGSGIAQDTLCRIDMHAGSVTRRTDNDEMGYGEPVFIPRENSTAEDDGYVMALRHNRSTNLSDLCVFDAAHIADDPVAVVHLPARVPNGFHGNWVSSHQLN
ncbi:MAG: carotenoid oxygenase family protein, partial [Ilumatobacteraceae bacterium]